MLGCDFPVYEELYRFPILCKYWICGTGDRFGSQEVFSYDRYVLKYFQCKL